MSESLTIYPAEARGNTDLGWLHSRHSFSFGSYFNAEQMGFRKLRVMNDDEVAPGMGFGSHPHRDMEIFSYIISGALSHRDSMGNQKTVQAGEVQYMSAGRGITHSEFNASKTDPVHFLQFWIETRQIGLEPIYAEWKSKRSDLLQLIASPNGTEGSLAIRQDVLIHLGHWSKATHMTYILNKSRAFWLQMMIGDLTLNGKKLRAGDAISTESAGNLDLTSTGPAHFLLFDLAEK